MGGPLCLGIHNNLPRDGSVSRWLYRRVHLVWCNFSRWICGLFVRPSSSPCKQTQHKLWKLLYIFSSQMFRKILFSQFVIACRPTSCVGVCSWSRGGEYRPWCPRMQGCTLRWRVPGKPPAGRAPRLCGPEASSHPATSRRGSTSGCPMRCRSNPVSRSYRLEKQP